MPDKLCVNWVTKLIGGHKICIENTLNKLNDHVLKVTGKHCIHFKLVK